MELKPVKIDSLSPNTYKAVMERSMQDISSVYEGVRKIVEDIRERGDAVTLEHYKKHKDDIAPPDLEATPDEIKEAYNQLDPEVVECLKAAAQNIIKFHKAQLERDMWSIEVQEGILAGRITRAMDIVGCYIPGGTAIYPSSILMTVLPAKVAGVDEVVAITPPSKGMKANPATLVAADIAGCDRIFKVGGPWGVAGIAYGTKTMPRVHKIVGHG
ncbi:MAG: histidinol dehydrogenase, partial [Deltaproteobacteria bacterium]|nr:histidinol dehydrogenase [Deltaproteobacteria bacterium]